MKKKDKIALAETINMILEMYPVVQECIIKLQKENKETFELIGQLGSLISTLSKNQKLLFRKLGLIDKEKKETIN